jgi:DNA polymerase-3 subunit gamma/tau
LIARAAEGSARDGLSILDQAIAHGSGAVTADQVRAMLGLSDRGAIRSLLGLLMAGDAPGALAAVRDQYDLGVEPAALLRSLLEAVHGITRAKVGGARDPAQSDEEREAYADWAARLSYPLVHRLWQLLLKGLGEVHQAPLPLEAAEMALLRVIHASELPDPGQLAARLAGGGGAVVAAGLSASPAPVADQSMHRAPTTFAALTEGLHAKGFAVLAHNLNEDVGLVRYAPPELVLRPLRTVSDLQRNLREALKKAWPNQQWQVSFSEEDSAQASLKEQEMAEEERVRQEVLASPMVSAVREAFPDAELADYTAGNQRS